MEGRSSELNRVKSREGVLEKSMRCYDVKSSLMLSYVVKVPAC